MTNTFNFTTTAGAIAFSAAVGNISGFEVKGINIAKKEVVVATTFEGPVPEAAARKVHACAMTNGAIGLATTSWEAGKVIGGIALDAGFGTAKFIGKNAIAVGGAVVKRTPDLIAEVGVSAAHVYSEGKEGLIAGWEKACADPAAQEIVADVKDAANAVASKVKGLFGFSSSSWK